MIIVCENCKTSFDLDEGTIQDKVFRVRCSECDHVFTAYKPPPTSETAYLLKKNPVVEQHKNTSVNERKIIAICNQKGGVGKTSTCLNLGAALSALNKRVLLVDFDLQASLTILFGYKGKKSLYDILDGGMEEMLAAIQNPYRNLWLLPSNLRMMFLQNYNNKKFEWTLKDKLNLISKHFDYILIDTPPSVEFFTLNALMAADLVIITTQCEYLSLNGVGGMVDIIQSLKQKKGFELRYRILATMYDEKTVASKAIYNKLRNTYKEKLFDVVIEVDKKIQESQIFKKPVVFYDKNSKATSQYLALAKIINS